MTERKKLIELLHRSEILCDDCGPHGNSYCTEAIADYLLANGVIVPLCKVGDTVYVDETTWFYNSFLYYENLFIHSKHFLVGEIVSIIKTKKQLLIKIRVSNSIHSRYRHKRYPASAIGKTVFLAKDDAEKALKERSEGK